MPSIGVPTALTLNEVLESLMVGTWPSSMTTLAFVTNGSSTLDWLGKNIPACRWVKIAEAAWAFGGWGHV